MAGNSAEGWRAVSWERREQTETGGSLYLHVSECIGPADLPRYNYAIHRQPNLMTAVSTSGRYGYATPQDAMEAADAALEREARAVIPFRTLSSSEEQSFREWARTHTTQDELAKGFMYHPVVRDEWRMLGVWPGR